MILLSQFIFVPTGDNNQPHCLFRVIKKTQARGLLICTSLLQL